MEEGSIGVEVLMVGLGWPTPTEEMEFWRPALGEPSFAVKRKRENAYFHSVNIKPGSKACFGRGDVHNLLLSL